MFFYEAAKKVAKKFGGYKKTLYLCTRLTEIIAVAQDRDLAQLVAHTSGGREVAGSSPVIPTERIAKRLIISYLAIFLFRNSRGIPVIMVVRALKGEGCCYLSLS